MSSTLTICPHCDTLNQIDIEKAKTKKPSCGKCHKELKLHSLVTPINENHLPKFLAKSKKPVIVDFWAPWCGPCKSYGPEFEQASLENQDAVFLKINVDSNQTLSSSLGIRGIPCTILFKDGQEVRRQSGSMSMSEVKSFILNS